MSKWILSSVGTIVHRTKGFWSYPTSELATEVGLVMGEYCSSSCSLVVEQSLM